MFHMMVMHKYPQCHEFESAILDHITIDDQPGNSPYKRAAKELQNLKSYFYDFILHTTDVPNEQTRQSIEDMGAMTILEREEYVENNYAVIWRMEDYYT